MTDMKWKLKIKIILTLELRFTYIIMLSKYTGLVPGGTSYK